MDDDTQILVTRLIAGDTDATAEILRRVGDDDSPVLLVAAALGNGTGATHRDHLLARAAAHAVTTRDRQLVAIATAHLDGDGDLLDALVRDHLADHPDSLLAAWIATRSLSPRPSTSSSTRPSTQPSVHQELSCDS